jgi:hypothetical protein
MLEFSVIDLSIRDLKVAPLSINHSVFLARPTKAYREIALNQ